MADNLYPQEATKQMDAALEFLDAVKEGLRIPMECHGCVDEPLPQQNVVTSENGKLPPQRS